MRTTLSILALMAFAACDCNGGGKNGSGTENQAPVLAAIGARSVQELQALSFAVHATDTAGSTLTLSATGLPAGAVFDRAGGDGTFTWTPGFGTAGVYPVTFTVSDGEKTDQEQVEVTVTPEPAPVLDPIGARSVHELETLTFTVHAADAGGGTLALSAAGLPAGATFDASGGDGTFRWSPAEGTFGVYPVTFTASDGYRTDDELVQVTVLHRLPHDPAVDVAGPTSFLQFIPNQDPDAYQYLPGAANFWDLTTDFALLDGGNDQFDGALELHVGTAASPADDPRFPEDQTYAELTFSTPHVGAAEGLAPVAIGEGPDWAGDGNFSAWMGGTSGTRLWQAIDLTGAAAPITLTFLDTAITGQSQMPSPDDAYRVVIRDAAGELLETLLETSTETGGVVERDLSAYAGQVITLSFELVGGAYDAAGVDDVSIQSDGIEYVQNGDFETGDLGGWTVGVAGQSSNLTSAPRSVGGLTVTRSFYTLPTQEWARWVDVFENPTAAAITVNASYLSVLGSAGAGIIFASEDGRSVSAFDGRYRMSRDVGWVFGGAAGSIPTVSFQSATALGTADGSPEIWAVFPVTVPAGGRVAIVNYLVLTGVDTGSLAGTTVATHPAEVEAVNAAILAGYGVDPIYQDYMTEEQRAAVANF